jgi:hypothetical protein
MVNETCGLSHKFDLLLMLHFTNPVHNTTIRSKFQREETLIKGPERGRRVDAHTTKCTVYSYIGASSLDDCSAQVLVFPYNIFAYCSIFRVDCKFARNKKK